MHTQPTFPKPNPTQGYLPRLLLGLAMAAILGGCSAWASEPPPARLPYPAKAFASEARRILAGLDDRAKAGQVLLVGVGGQGRLPTNEARAIRDLGPGGVVLFGFNIGEDTRAVGSLIGGLQDSAQASRAALPLLVAVDHEGGPVFRFSSGLTRLPAAAVVGGLGGAYARTLGEVAGTELRALGFNLALAPVVELSRKDNASILGLRCYGKEAKVVDAAAGGFILGLESRGVAATAKHFPGNAGVDPHKGLPRLEVDAQTLERDYVARFRSAISRGVGVVLLSHVMVPALDPERPVTLSKKAVTGLLKGRLGFDGVVLTDDLFMQALAATNKPEESAVEALQAGADLLMLSEGSAAPRVRDAILASLSSGGLSRARLDDAVLRIIELKLRFRVASGLDAEARAEALASLPGLVEGNAARLAAMKR